MERQPAVEIKRDDLAEAGAQNLAVEGVVFGSLFLPAQLLADALLQLPFGLERIDLLVNRPAAQKRFPLGERAVRKPTELRRRQADFPRDLPEEARPVVGVLRPLHPGRLDVHAAAEDRHAATAIRRALFERRTQASQLCLAG